MEYYSAIKRNKIIPFAATWMDLEVVILSEVEPSAAAPSMRRWVYTDGKLGKGILYGEEDIKVGSDLF